MDIHEHQAKQILKKYGAVVPEGTFEESIPYKDKTLWTGLTKWRKGSSFAPVDMPSAELLIENLLVNL